MKATLERIQSMEKGLKSTQMGLSMKVSGGKAQQMEMEYSPGQMEQSILESLRME